MFWNWMLQSKEFKPETLTLRQSPSNDMLQYKRFTGEITENFAHQSPRGNMHKLLDCIRTPLKRFLACLTFHRKEKRLRHLHKRTNPGSAPAQWSSFLCSSVLCPNVLNASVLCSNVLCPSVPFSNFLSFSVLCSKFLCSSVLCSNVLMFYVLIFYVLMLE